jgi:arylformamidase
MKHNPDTSTSNPIYDVSVALAPDLPVWPGDPPGEIVQVAFPERDGYQLRRISASLHWGTHVDAPVHFWPQGWTIEQIPLSLLMGETLVVEIPGVHKITARELEPLPLRNYRRLLLKTRNSRFWHEHPLRFHSDFTALTADAAELLVERGIQLVGIDYASVDLFDAHDLPVHHLLYRHNVVGIENLDLYRVPPGVYHMICLPIRIRQAEGAFARVVLTSR